MNEKPNFPKILTPSFSMLQFYQRLKTAARKGYGKAEFIESEQIAGHKMKNSNVAAVKISTCRKAIEAYNRSIGERDDAIVEWNTTHPDDIQPAGKAYPLLSIPSLRDGRTGGNVSASAMADMWEQLGQEEDTELEEITSLKE